MVLAHVPLQQGDGGEGAAAVAVEGEAGETGQDGEAGGGQVGQPGHRQAAGGERSELVERGQSNTCKQPAGILMLYFAQDTQTFE